jgi:hypothetical protein
MTAPLLAAFGAAGGMPPATLESLRVLADGQARAIVGSAWPEGSPQDEAGLYATRLGENELKQLRALAADRSLRALDPEHGPISSDSGRSSLSLAGADGETVEIAWGAFAKPPDPLPAAVATLRRMLALVREHPVAALRFAVELDGEPGRDGVPLAFTLSNPGHEAVRHSLMLQGAEAPRVAVLPASGAQDPLVLSNYRTATPVALLDDPLREDGLAAGGEQRLLATAPLALEPGEHALVAFGRGTLEVIVDGRPLGLEVFLIARAGTVWIAG